MAEEVWQHRLVADPHLRVQHGLPVERLRSHARAELEADASAAREWLRRLGDLDTTPDALGLQDRLTLGRLRALLEQWVDAPRWSAYVFSVAPYTSFFQSYGERDALTSAGLSSAEDCDRYVALVADVRRVLDERLADLREQRQAGVLLPRPALPAARETLARQRAGSAALLVPQQGRFDGLDPAVARAARTRVERVVSEEVLPAYDAMLAAIDDDYAGSAPSTVGFAQFPGGEEFYRAMVRQHTASSATPEQLHATGLREVAMLTERMAEVRAALGAPADEPTFHAQLAGDPRLHARAPEEVEARYRRVIAAMEPHLKDWFHTLPRAPYGVRRLDVALEAGMTYGYYQIPTPADPVGWYCYNGSELQSRSLLTAAALILHELAPGHHLHMARQREAEHLPPIRREAADIGAFNEGWAEYASGLGWEAGIYEDPLDAYGRLVHERFTAQRLVIDTGMNVLGWSLERARDYMRATTTESEVQIASETVRYSTDLPAQALAYRAGYLAFTQLRERASDVLGDGFDVRDLHEVFLAPGALPFGVVEEHVTHWLATGERDGVTP